MGPYMPKSKKNTDKPAGEKSDKKKTSLRLNSKTLKALKLRAIEDETSVQKTVESLVEDYLDQSGK